MLIGGDDVGVADYDWGIEAVAFFGCYSLDCSPDMGFGAYDAVGDSGCGGGMMYFSDFLVEVEVDAECLGEGLQGAGDGYYAASGGV